MIVKTEEMVAEERRFEDFLLQLETISFCGVTRILSCEEDLTEPKFKIIAGSSPSLAGLVELEVGTKIANTEWANCAEINLMVVLGRPRPTKLKEDGTSA
jgi:hypothetical protein